MAFASFTEVISIGSLVPFLAVITSPEKVFANSKVQFLINWLGIQSPAGLLMPLTIFFCIAVLIAGLSRLLLLWATTKISYALGADLSMSVYRKSLYQPFITHISRNSSELISGIATKTSSVILHVINPLLLATSSSIILIAILIVLVVVDPTVASITFIGFSLLYVVIIKATKTRLTKNANQIAIDTTRVIQSLQEGLGGIRDVLLGGAQEIFCDIYQKADLTLRKAQASNYFIGNSPRFIIEASGMVLIAIIALILARQDNSSGSTILILGLFALGAQRLLPVLQQMYYSWTTIKGNQETLSDIINLLDQKMPVIESIHSPLIKRIEFTQTIALEQTSFRYGESMPWVLKNINLAINKGSRVGFIGETGSGKSTLLDIVMALLAPTTGVLKIDGITITENNYDQWQLNIAHVPQSIYLIDSTISENIAFGEPKEKINFHRVKEAAQKAQIARTIESWEHGYDTIVGERGVRLSGGQRQRIAIARALYKEASLIIFDEATSALDEETEESLMGAIDSLSNDLTILIIAHRLSTLRNCNHILELVDGRIKNIGTYQNLIG
ncbi:ABC transporter ATP-binding protein [Polynucleobacter paneuropaeus]|nr:ABC transporter ATP-binding protein [Polynucleobacter paneuropaeus]